ncbi:MAG: hypothetical protein Q8L09_00090 [Candidatus Moranbacteria bacterium]|nr:hypothetical protein [Candidatus Moranbacteria bacterium]
MKQEKSRPVVVLDNEGPCTKNDNAFELFVAILMLFGFSEKAAAATFRNLSVIDDIWGDFKKMARLDPTYSAGHTLKVILPFIRALGTKLEWLYEFSKSNILVVPKIDLVIPDLQNRGYEIFQISTSYSFFIEAFCDLVGLDFQQAYCTRIDPKLYNGVSTTTRQKNKLLKFLEELSQMPPVKYDHLTGEIAENHQKNYDRITGFIWYTVRNMEVGRLMKEVHPVGQFQKYEALKDIAEIADQPLRRIMYVGDSQTDVEVARYLLNKGLVMMFNGKGHQVCELSDIMYIGQDARAITEVADVFDKSGREGAISFCAPSRQAHFGGKLHVVTSENVKRLEARSENMRKKFRGVHIGSLT